jgi:hypothetical protein
MPHHLHEKKFPTIPYPILPLAITLQNKGIFGQVRFESINSFHGDHKKGGYFDVNIVTCIGSAYVIVTCIGSAYVIVTCIGSAYVIVTCIGSAYAISNVDYSLIKRL